MIIIMHYYTTLKYKSTHETTHDTAEQALLEICTHLSKYKRKQFRKYYFEIVFNNGKDVYKIETEMFAALRQFSSHVWPDYPIFAADKI